MRGAWVFVALLCALAGCSAPTAGPSETAQASEPSGRITVPDAVVTFPRTLQADRMVEAQVVTAGPGDAVVTSARLESPLFADSPTRDSGPRLFPDWANRVRVPLGEAVCPAPVGESTVALTITIDGREVTETLEFDDAVLLKINADECAEQAVLDVAAPSFGPVESQTASEIHTTIVMTRGAAQRTSPVALSSMTGNIVYIVTLDAAADATLDAGQETIAVPAVVTVGRCDPHVFAESKKTFVFPVRLAIDGAEPAYVEIQPDPTARAALQALFNTCENNVVGN